MNRSHFHHYRESYLNIFHHCCSDIYQSIRTEIICWKNNCLHNVYYVYPFFTVQCKCIILFRKVLNFFFVLCQCNCILSFDSLNNVLYYNYNFVKALIRCILSQQSIMSFMNAKGNLSETQCNDSIEPGALRPLESYTFLWKRF